MRLRAIEVEAFRGFGEKFRFDFGDADVLVLYGPNGHGKTSLFDAVEWALTGQLFRYEEETTAERKQYRYIGNQFHRGTQPRVCLEMQVEDGREIMITRTNTAKASDVTDGEKHFLQIVADGQTLEGERAEAYLRKLLVHEDWRETMPDVGKGLFLTHLLSQERMSRFLRGMKESERYESVSLMFGTEHFNRYRQVFHDARKELEQRLGEVEQERQARESEHRALQQQLEELAPQVAVVLPDQSQLLVAGELPLEQVRQDVQALEPEREELQREQAKLTRARHFFQEWQEHQPSYEANLQRVKGYLALESLDDRLRKVAWLTSWLDDYEKNVRRHVELTELQQTGAQELQALQERKSDLEALMKQVSQVPNTDIGTWLDKLRELLPSLKDHLHEIRLTWRESLYKKDLAEQSKRVVDVLEEKNNQAHQVGMELTDLLRKLADFATNHPDLQECPACGTSGVTADHLAVHVQSRIQLLDPRDLRERDEREAARERWETAQAELARTERLLHDQMAKMNEEVRKLREQAVQLTQTIQDLQQTNRRHHTELHDLEKSITDFQTRAQSIGLQATGSALRLELHHLARQTQQQWDDLAGDEPSTWRESFESCKRAVQRAKEVRLALHQSLQALSLHPKDAGEVSTLLQTAELNHLAREADFSTREAKLTRLLQLVEGASVVSRYQQLLQRAEFCQARLTELSTRISELHDRIDLLKSVRKKIPEAVAKLNGEVMDDLFATMRSIFVKINSHPRFRELAYDTTKKRDINHLFLTVLAGIGADGEATVEANPSYIFSSAQINAVALSFFLAMALKQQWSPLQVIALDDPVQSMDDLNVMALIDLIRTLLQTGDTRRQFIISTHDATFYELMLKKFRFLRVGVIEYEGYSEKGPLTYRDLREPLSPDINLQDILWTEQQASRA